MIRPPASVLCVGNIVFDILVRPVDAVHHGTTMWVEAIEQHMGGNGANTSYALAKLGVPVRLAGLVGTDVFGDHLLQRLQQAGVQLEAVGRDTAPTATTVALINAIGSRAFLHHPGVSRAAFQQPIPFSNGHAGSHFHLGNVFALPHLRGGAADTLRRAREAGLTTSFDTGWDPLNEWMDVIGPCLPYVDLMFVNEDESRMLAGTAEVQQAARFFRRHGVASLIVKLGARGCVVFDRDEHLEAPGFRIDVVDTTGAGDCFAGGFLAALHRGMTVAEAARFANAVGALSVQQVGATTGLLSFQETVAWIRNQA